MAANSRRAKIVEGRRYYMSAGEFATEPVKMGNVYPDCRFDAELSYLGIQNKAQSGHMKPLLAMKRPKCHEAFLAGWLLWSLCQQSGDHRIWSRLAEL